jgi:hypothetical protein
MRSTSVYVTKLLADRAREIRKTFVAGDKSISRQVAEEFTAYFRQIDPTKTEDAIYQSVRYYLRQTEQTTTTKAYAKGVVAKLACLPIAERAEFAKATGRSLRAVNAAVTRYMKRNKTSELFKTDADVEAEAAANQVLSFSSFADMRYIGISRGDLVKARKILSGRYGLSLRAPNFLVHSPTKKRYALSISEQKALLENPVQFIRAKAEHIKNSWVVTEETI